MSFPDGWYQGTIVTAGVEEDQYQSGGMVAVFEVEIADGDQTDLVVCRHMQLPKDKGEMTAKVFETLGLEFPAGFAQLEPLAGRAVRVRLKTSDKGNQNAYIASPKGPGKKLTVEEINARLAGEDVPF